MSKAFKPLLAETIEDVNLLQFPVDASPKLDGIRCLIRDGQAVSRNLKPIRNASVQDWVASWRDSDGSFLLDGLDGELISGEHDEGVYNRTSSVVMSADGGIQWTYWVFDFVPYAANGCMGYQNRLLNAKRAYDLTKESCQRIKLVPVKRCNNVAELLAFEDECLQRGYEGVMVRQPDGPYKNGRSTVKEGYLLKLKRFEDAEATIIGWEERYHNHNEEKRDATGKINRSTDAAGLVPAGDLGALVCRTTEGIEFKIGTGFDAAQRVQLWQDRDRLLGKLVKYKFFAQGVKVAPRFPVFLGFRDEADLS